MTDKKSIYTAFCVEKIEDRIIELLEVGKKTGGLSEQAILACIEQALSDSFVQSAAATIMTISEKNLSTREFGDRLLERMQECSRRSIMDVVLRHKELIDAGVENFN